MSVRRNQPPQLHLPLRNRDVGLVAGLDLQKVRQALSELLLSATRLESDSDAVEKGSRSNSIGDRAGCK